MSGKSASFASFYTKVYFVFAIGLEMVVANSATEEWYVRLI